MNGAWIQARSFDEIVPVVILILWGVGKLMASRAAARKGNSPPPARSPIPPPRPGTVPSTPPRSGGDELRRFLAKLTGEEIPPAVPPALPELDPPEPMSATLFPPRPDSFQPAMDRMPVAGSLADRSGLRGRQRRRKSPAPPPLMGTPYPAFAPHGVAGRHESTVSVASAPATISAFRSTAMRDFNVAGPRVGGILRVVRAGAGHATWQVHPLLSDVRRLREAVILRTVLSPPRALDPL